MASICLGLNELTAKSTSNHQLTNADLSTEYIASKPSVKLESKMEVSVCEPKELHPEYDFFFIKEVKTPYSPHVLWIHYIDVIMTTIASQITSLTVVYSIFYSDADQRKHQSSASLAFVWGIHRDRWIPRTKGQLCGKCFHLMMSSWYFYTDHNSWHIEAEIKWLSFGTFS